MLSKFLKIIAFIILISLNESFANIIYEKDNIIITEIELEKYKELDINSTGEELSNKEIIKKIVLIKKTIEKVIIRNPEAMDQIDANIKLEIGKENFEDEVKRDYFRFFKIRNELIFEYFRNEFDLSDLKNVFLAFNEIKIPISSNNCLTIDNVIDLKNNEIFLKSYFYNLKNNKSDYTVMLDNKEYSACINQNIYRRIEAGVINYIKDLTEGDFKKFIYE